MSNETPGAADVRDSRSEPVPHIIALVAGIAAIVAFFAIPSSMGIVGYLLMIAVSGVAAAITHRSIRRRGAFLWASIVGMSLSYLVLIVAAGMLVARLTRTIAG